MSFFKRKQKHVRVVPNQDFLHGPTRFEKGKEYRVDISLARYFERNGWLEGSDLRPPIGSALTVDNGVLGTKDGR